MPPDLFNTLWISTHLLYPNSAQARDVFKQIVEALSAKPNKNRAITDSKIFEVLTAVYSKVTAIKSGASYFQFKNENLKYWSIALQKCHKAELLIILGVLVHNLSISQTAKALNITDSRARYLLNQAVRKVIPFDAGKLDLLSANMNMRKYQEQKTSYLFITENIIEYAFHIIDHLTARRLEKALQEHPEFLDYKAKAEAFYAELTTVESLENYENLLVEKPNVEQLSKNFHTQSSFPLKWLVSAAAGLFIIAGVLIVRPKFVSQVLEIKQNPVVEIEEIKIARASKSVHDTGIEGSDVAVTAEVTVAAAVPTSQAIANMKAITNVMSVDKVTVVSVNNPITSPSIVAIKKTAPIELPQVKVVEPITVVTPSLEETKVVVEKPAPAKQMGGIFRGDLSVNDIEQVTKLLREKIVILGGKKAGEVELGWKKNSKTSYFHFAFPEENVDELRSYIQQFGKSDLIYEPHPRQMPAGIKRVIIEVTESE